MAMKHLNLILAILCLLTWAGLYVVYYKEQIIPWLVNRFTRDKMPKDVNIKDGYFPDGLAIPFRENLYPSKKQADLKEGGKDTPPSQQTHEDGTKDETQPPTPHP